MLFLLQYARICNVFITICNNMQRFLIFGEFFLLQYALFLLQCARIFKVFYCNMQEYATFFITICKNMQLFFNNFWKKNVIGICAVFTAICKNMQRFFIAICKNWQRFFIVICKNMLLLLQYARICNVFIAISKVFYCNMQELPTISKLNIQEYCNKKPNSKGKHDYCQIYLLVLSINSLNFDKLLSKQALKSQVVLLVK